MGLKSVMSLPVRTHCTIDHDFSGSDQNTHERSEKINGYIEEAAKKRTKKKVGKAAGFH